MQKRTEEKKKEKQLNKYKYRAYFLIILCVIFFILSLRVADSSIKSLMLCEKSKNAFNLSYKENILTFEFAGCKYDFNISYVIRSTKELIAFIKKLIVN